MKCHPYVRSDASKVLIKRFFISSYNGNTKKFYDVVTGRGDILSGALCDLVSREYSIDWPVAKRIVEGCPFATLSPPMLYRPNKPPIVIDQGLYHINSWRPPQRLKNTPSLLGVQPFVDHIEDVLGSKEKADYFLDVLAWRVQNPYEPKPHIAFYFYHEEGGQGKSVFGSTLQRVLGANSVKIVNTADSIGQKGSVDTWSCSWLVVEEAFIKKASTTYNTIKSYTGGDSVTTDKKYGAYTEYEVPAMLIMLSNKPPNFIEPNDRRFFVSEWKLKECPDEEAKARYFERYFDWLNNGGYEAIADHLATRLTYTDVRANAMITEEKRVAMNVAKSPVQTALKDFLEDKLDYWLFTNDAFDSIWYHHRISTSRQQHELSAAGLIQFDKRTKIGEKQFRPWMRKGTRIISMVGKVNQAEFDGVSKPITDVTLFNDRWSGF